MTRWRRSDLTAPAKRGLVIILEEGSISRQAGYWSSSSKQRVSYSTITALYDRYLIKIVVESRHRRQHTAYLTDVGEYAAKEIQRELALEETERAAATHGVTERSARFINEVTS